MFLRKKAKTSRIIKYGNVNIFSNFYIFGRHFCLPLLITHNNVKFGIEIDHFSLLVDNRQRRYPVRDKQIQSLYHRHIHRRLRMHKENKMAQK